MFTDVSDGPHDIRLLMLSDDSSDADLDYGQITVMEIA
jgi:hypothetical protein